MSAALASSSAAINSIASSGTHNQTAKPSLNLVQLKKKFGSLAQQLEQEYKLNTSIYKQKYYELSDGLNGLYCELRKYDGDLHALNIDLNKENSTHVPDKQNQVKSRKNIGHVSHKQNMYNTTKSEDKRKRTELEIQIDPLSIVDYFRDFCHGMVQICLNCKDKQNRIKQDLAKLFSAQSDLHYLEVLAQKNLQNYDLALRAEELENLLSLKTAQTRLAEKTTQQYQKKFKDQEKDFNEITISIANMLKQCELSEIELRQENRFQKELIQTHKIQFELYKSDFKMKPSYEQKTNRIRQVLEKKFLDREAIIVKQSERMAQNKFRTASKAKLKHNDNCSEY